MRTHTFGTHSIASGTGLTEATDGFASHGGTKRGGLPPAAFSIRSMFSWYRERLDRRHHRAVLAELTDHQLWDIGVSREARDREVRRSFWK
jgi:uncharacterized protein YjiS (DUF1127 family)